MADLMTSLRVVAEPWSKNIMVLERSKPKSVNEGDLLHRCGPCCVSVSHVTQVFDSAFDILRYGCGMCVRCYTRLQVYDGHPRLQPRRSEPFPWTSRQRSSSDTTVTSAAV